MQEREKIFEPGAQFLTFLLASIHNREVALPDFQRDFVWDPRATEELIESICRSFPAGSLLRIKTSAAFFAPREIAGAPSLNGHPPSYLILDGQQRLTSLYQAFYGVGTHRYYVNLEALVNDADLEDAVFHERRVVGEKRYGSDKKQASSLVFPFPELVNGGFEEWLDRILEIRAERGEEQKELKAKLRDVYRQWVKPIVEYEFPIITLSDKTEVEAVCTIFETLNRTGVKLSVFDLLTARFWPESLRLRDMWLQAQQQHPIIAEFDVDPYYILQAISIHSAYVAGLSTSESRPPLSCKRSDVLQMNVDQIRSSWDAVVKGLASTLTMLRDECGVVLPQWLPYVNMLIPAAVTMAAIADKKGPAVADARNKLMQWFWCGVFGQFYENSPNSQSVKDFTEIMGWIEGGAPPETVSTYSFDPEVLRQVTPKQRAIYRGIIALVLRHGARDFHRGDRITAAMVREEEIDDHHVFPRGFLEDTRPDVASSLRDCVLNRTLIDRITNIRIGKRAPSDYLAEIEDIASASQLERILESHLLATGKSSALRRDDFDAFIAERLEAITEQLKRVTE